MLNRTSKRNSAAIICTMLFTALSAEVVFAAPSDTAKLLPANDTASAPASDSSLTITFKVVNEAKTKAPEVQLNRLAVKYVADYKKAYAETLEKVRDISPSYFKLIEGIFEKQGIPAELKYLAVIESRLKRTAVSQAGAAGPWQIMPTTARLLGLKVNGKTDERKHYYKSTYAAARYLKSLYDMYEDWLLVIAAYNAGPGNVNKAIRNSGSRNFWKLQYHLPAETRNHVKRFIGTHYYFENGGSETTLTKAEADAFKKIMASYLAEKEKQMEEVIVNIPLQPATITEQEMAAIITPPVPLAKSK